ncbi:MAG: tetratricopeptide repeat protein [Myxococcota bacterium]|nr:tetratricopeptide repeat protein [Myxococcota bacterium]
MRKFLMICVLALAGATFVACQSDEAKLADHLARAGEYYDDESWSEAIIEFKNALQIDPNNAEAHYKLSQAYLKTKKTKEAFWELRETVRIDPSNHDAKLQFAQISVYAGELEEALKRADEVIAADPNRADAYIVKAQAHEGLKQLDETLAALENAIRVEPENGGAYLLIATFVRRQGDRESAEKYYKEAVRVDPKAVSFLALGGFYAEEREDEEAEAAYRRAVELSTEDEDLTRSYSVLGSFQFRRERFDDAVATLEEGIEKADDSLELIYLLARMYREQGNIEKADELALLATQEKPDDPAPFLVLSAYRGQVGDLRGALEAAEKAMEVTADGDPAAELRVAEIELEIGFKENEPDRVQRGREIAERILAEDPANAAALFVKAKLDIAEKRLDEAVTGMRAAIDLRPDWAKAHFLLGTALALTGERTAARTELARALEIDASILEARRLLVDVHAALGEHEYAVEEGRRYLTQKPEAAKTRIRVAQSLVILGRVDEALREVQSIPEENRDVEVNYAIGRIHLGRGENEEARAFLGAALEQRSGNADILRSLLDLDRREGRLEESVSRIEAAVAATPDDANLQQLKGQLSLMQGDGAAAETAFKRSIELDPNLVSSYRQLANFYAATGRTSETIQTYEESLKVRPNQPQIHHFLGVLYEYGGQPKKAIEHYETAIRYEPNLGEAKNNLAYMYAEKGENLDRALDLAQEAKALMPDNPNTADTLGWVLFRRGVPSAAIGYLKEAVAGIEAGDASKGLVRHHLAQAYEASGDTANAKSTAEAALADHQAYAEARQAAGGTVEEPGWYGEAKALIERLN